MVRLIVSVVFALSVLAASSSHAAMLPSNFVNGMHAEIGSGVDRPCEASRTVLLSPTHAHCAISAHQTGSSKRCQVDVAPLADRNIDFGANRDFQGWMSTSKIAADWLCKPMLGPPRSA